jgi:hypothetical protein
MQSAHHAQIYLLDQLHPGALDGQIRLVERVQLAGGAVLLGAHHRIPDEWEFLENRSYLGCVANDYWRQYRESLESSVSVPWFLRGLNQSQWLRGRWEKGSTLNSHMATAGVKECGESSKPQASKPNPDCLLQSVIACCRR